jgi:LacI family transcriptional regulator
MAVDKPVTLKMIAEHCGVHFTTVSAALRGDLKHVNAKTAKRIKTAARKLGYDATQTQAARRLRASLGKTRVSNDAVAIFFPPSFADPVERFHNRLFLGLHSRLAECSLAEVIIANHAAMVVEGEVSGVPPIVTRGEVDGAVIWGWGKRYAEIVSLLRSRAGFGNRPIVSLMNRIAGCMAVVADEGHGGCALAGHLLDLGHRRLLHASSPESVNDHNGRERYLGYEQACADRGLDPAKILIRVEPEHRRLPGRVLKALKGRRPPTAVLAPNDLAACAIASELEAKGVRIPDDVSLAGFDDTHGDLGGSRPDWLTSVRVPLHRMGRTAGDLILNALEEDEGEATALDRFLVVPCELVMRASTGAHAGRRNDKE